MEMDLNTDLLDKEIELLNSIGDQFSVLGSAMSKINMGGVTLKSASVFSQAIDTVNNLVGSGYDLSISDLKERVTDVRNTLLNNDSSMSSLFSDLDDMSYDEFGNFSLIDEHSLTRYSDLYGYLEDNYNDCEIRISDSGDVYYYVNDYGNIYYISGDCANGSAEIYTYFPGQGGSSYSYDTYKNSLEQDGVPSCAIVAFSGIASNVNLFSSVDKIIDGANLDVTGAHVVSFSASGYTGFAALNDYLKENPQITNSSMIVGDGYNIQYSGTVMYDELINRGTRIYMVDPTWPGRRDGTPDMLGLSTRLEDLGYNISYIKENSGTYHHNSFVNKIAVDGLSLFLSGRSVEINNASDYTFVDDVNAYKNGASELLPIYNINNEDFAVPEETIVPQPEPETTPTVPEEPIVLQTEPESTPTVPEEPSVPQPEPEPTPTVPEEPIVPQSEPEPTPTVPEEPIVSQPQPETTPTVSEEPIVSQPSPEPTPTVPDKPIVSQPQPETTPTVSEEPIVSQPAPEPTPTVPDKPIVSQPQPETTPTVPEEPIVSQPQPEPTPIVPEEPIVSQPQPEPTPIVPDEPIVSQPQPEPTPTVSEEPIVSQPQPEPTPIVPEEPIVSQPEPETTQTVPEKPIVSQPQPETTPTVPEEPSIYNSNAGLNNAKKYILPGILGTSLAAFGAKLGSKLKKKKDDNDI